jgi:hypothetical protein
MSNNIKDILGKDAELLLNHVCKAIPKEIYGSTAIEAIKHCVALMDC